MSIDAPDVTWQTQAAAARAAVRARETVGFDQGRALLALGGVIMVAFLGFVLGLALGVRGEDVTMLGLAMLTFALALSPIAVDLGRPQSDRHTFVSLVCLIFVASYVIPVLAVYIPAEGPIDAPAMAETNLLPGDLVVGQLVVLMSLAVILAVYASPIGRGIASRLPRPRVEWPLPTIIVLALLMMAIGWPIRIASGVGAMPTEWGSGFFGTLYKGTTYSNVILMLAWMRHRSYFALFLMLANILLGGLLGLLQASKTEMLMQPFIIAVTWTVVHRSFPFRWIAGGVLALMVLYPSVSFIRVLQEDGWSPQEAFTNPVRTLNLVGRHVSQSGRAEWLGAGLEATTQRTDQLGVASVLIRDTPRVSPFLYGETLKLFFVAFVPRIIWPDKPVISTGQFTTSVYGSGPQVSSNTAPTQIGDFYINFGVPGVIGGMALLGLMIRVAHEAFLWKGGTAASILMLTLIIYHLTIAFEGNVGIVYSNVVFAIVPMWGATLLARFMLPTYVRKIDEPTRAPAPARAASW